MPSTYSPAAGGAAAGGDGGIAGRQPPSNNLPAKPAQRPELRPYQRAVIERIATTAERRILLVAPTGSGKTVIASAIIRDAVACRLRVAFLDHRRELTRQASQKLYEFGVDHGIIQAGFPARPSAPVQVASIQTLHARAIRGRSIELPPADIVVVDEAHHARAETYQRLIAAYPTAVIIGLTATPCRGDGRGLGNIFQVLIECSSVAELIDGGFLVGTRVYAPTRPDLTGVHVRHGDYVEAELAFRMNTAKLVGDVVEHWLRLGEHRPTVVFAVDVAHSVHLRNEFRRTGVLAEHLDGSTPLEERDRILAQLADGTIDLVTNCMVLTEGWDQPSVSCLVLARPTKSLGLYRQMVGRCLRPFPGKTDALILDHSGATFEHGFAEDEIVWTLDEDRRAENRTYKARGSGPHAPALVDCPECESLRYEGKPCPACGWRPQPRPRQVEILDGELGVLYRNRKSRDYAYTTEEKRRFYAELRSVALSRGYKPKWAAWKFKDKHGNFPPWAWNNEPTAEPSFATLSWVKSRNIAWAKSQHRAGT